MTFELAPETPRRPTGAGRRRITGGKLTGQKPALETIISPAGIGITTVSGVPPILVCEYNRRCKNNVHIDAILGQR